MALQYESDGTGIDNARPTVIGTDNISVGATVNNYAVAEITASGGELTQNGNNYVLNLGTVTQGDSPQMVNLSITNGATGPADLLSGNMSLISNDGFSDTDAGTFSGLAAGASADVQQVSLNPTSPGSFTETFSIEAAGSNDSGYNAPLPADTVTVEETVLSAPTEPTVPSPPAATAPPSPPAEPPPYTPPTSQPTSPPPAAPAVPVITNGPTIDFGSMRVGDDASQHLSIMNAATPPADGLNASVDDSSITGDATGTGSFTNLPPGQTNSTSIEVGINTTTAGDKSGDVPINFGSISVSTVSDTSVLDFSTTNQSMWATGSAVNFAQDWTIPLLPTLGGSDTVTSGPFALSVGASANADLTASLSASTGAVSVGYPVNVLVDVPSAVSAGNSFTVDTNVTGVTSPTLSATFPNLNASLALTVAAQAYASLSATYDYFGATATITPVNFSKNITLASLSSGQSTSAFGVTVSVPTDYSGGSSETTGSGILPDVTFDGQTGDIISAQSPDLFDVLFGLLGKPNPLSGSLSTSVLGIPVSANYTLLGAKLSGGIDVAQAFTFIPTESRRHADAKF